MSSTLSNIKPRKPRTSRTPKILNSGPKLSKKVLSNIESLTIYNSFNPLNQTMIKLVQLMYKNRDITNFKTAKLAIESLTINEDFKKFNSIFTKITKLADKKTIKAPIKKEIKQKKQDIKITKLVQETEKIALNPHVKFIQNAKSKFQKNNTIMPSYEIIINRDYNDFTKVWNECIRPLYRHSRDYMEQQQKPLKVRIGVKFTAFRPKTILELDEYIHFLNDEEEEEEKITMGSLNDYVYGILRLKKDEVNYIYMLNSIYLQ